MAEAVDVASLDDERRRYENTGGVSENNRAAGFLPAFMDTATGMIYLSRDPEGNPAPCHRLDGLPEELVAERDAQGRVMSVREAVVVGFEREGSFYTREQAANCVGAG